MDHYDRAVQLTRAVMRVVLVRGLGRLHNPTEKTRNRDLLCRQINHGGISGGSRTHSCRLAYSWLTGRGKKWLVNLMQHHGKLRILSGLIRFAYVQRS